MIAEFLPETLIAAFIALIMAIYGWLQRNEKVAAVEEKEEAIAFFDPENDAITNAWQVDVPARSWKMSGETKAYILNDLDATDRATVLKQIDAAEELGSTHYVVDFSNGYFVIDFGLVMGGGKDITSKEARERGIIE